MKKLFPLMIAMLVFPALVRAQLSAPPIKMGLWQSTNTITMTGFQIPPDVAARLQAMGRQIPGSEPHTTVVQSCLTPEKWKKMFSDMQQNKDCTFTNLHQSSSGMSADMECKSQSGDQTTSTGHMEATFDSSEKMHGKAHISTIMKMQPQPIIVDMHFDNVYQGSDCQGVSPDSPKIIR